MIRSNKMIMTICLASTLSVTSLSSINIKASSEPKISSSLLVDFDGESEYNDKITPNVKSKEDKIIIKSKPNSKSKAIGYLSAGGSATILRQYDDWVLIRSNTIKGWVKGKDICSGFDMNDCLRERSKLFNKVAKVKADVLRVRKSASNSSNIIDTVEKREELPILAHVGDWVKVDAGNEEGFVSKSYIETKIKFSGAEPISVDTPENDNTKSSNDDIDIDWSNLPENDDCSELRQNMVKYAYSKLGCKYVYGGESYKTGIDCSAFMQDIYRHFGMNLPRTSRSQAAMTDGIENIDEIQPGDLLFYISSHTGDVGHVSMYIGDGKVIHASNPNDGIKISEISYREPCKIINMISYFGRE